uniref:Uncharacterized protein n=1 Tax=Anguilla anguilla TaxID=7936 RepID=A0A0E9P6R0_ANGAN
MSNSFGMFHNSTTLLELEVTMTNMQGRSPLEV